MPAIKGIIFDVGGVLIAGDSLVKAIVSVFQPKNMDEFWQELNERLSPLCKGDGDLLAFWKTLADAHGLDIPEATLKHLLVDDLDRNLELNHDVAEIVRGFKGQYKLGIISNIFREHVSAMRRNDSFMTLHDLFDVVIFSCEVNMAKDSEDIFHLALGRLNLNPEECLFIDDTRRFVDVAKSIGMHAIQFKSAQQLRADIDKLPLLRQQP